MHGSAEFLDIRRFGLAHKVEDSSFVVCISDYCRSQLMWLVDPDQWEKLTVVHCGVDLPAGKAPVSRRGGTLTDMNILTVGRLVALKGHWNLIQAGALLRERGFQVKIRIVGAGPYEMRLRHLTGKTAADEIVMFLGAVGEEDLAEQYAWADVFCLPSMMEGVPVVLMEAMARGLPVVATQITGIGELVEDQTSGLLVRPGRADLLADALERVARDIDLRATLSREGYRRVTEEFDVVQSGRELQRVFQERVFGRLVVVK
jgi:glycosyltransferase involved in cell wall biosynthesis